MELPQTVAVKAVAKVAAVLLVILAVAGLLLVRSCNQTRQAVTKEKLSNNQTQAATQSGVDAVKTVGDRAAAEVHTDTVTREITHDIRSVPGATTTIVPPGVQRAGIAGLCRYAAYSGSPECLQQPSP